MSRAGAQLGSSNDREISGRESTGLTFGVAQTLSDVEDAWRLVYRAYRRAQLIGSNTSKIHVVPEALRPRTAVIVGRMGDLTVSTITVVGDDAGGLPLDRDHHEELSALRSEGRRLIEITLHADRRHSIERAFYALLELMRYAIWFGQYLGATDYLYSIPNAYEQLYHQAFGFTPISCGKHNTAGNENAIRLMRLDDEKVKKQHEAHLALHDIVTNPIPLEVFDGRFPLEREAWDVMS